MTGYMREYQFTYTTTLYLFNYTTSLHGIVLLLLLLLFVLSIGAMCESITLLPNVKICPFITFLLCSFVFPGIYLHNKKKDPHQHFALHILILQKRIEGKKKEYYFWMQEFVYWK